MRFAVIVNGKSPERDAVVAALVRTCLAKGHELAETPDGVNFVFNLTDTTNPRAFRRRSQSVFVFTFVASNEGEDNLKSVCYTTLIKSLSNLLLCVSPGEAADSPQILFTTPEAGFYRLPFDAEQIYQRLLPIAAAHFATENHFSFDLPARYHRTSPIVEQIKSFGQELDKLGVLPVPFPLREVLTEDAMRHLYKIYGITGASYGNLSARESIAELGQTTFWMTGRGINKARIENVGKDVLLVKGFNLKEGAALVSVPPGNDARARVSVDAIEHYLIYTSFPDVGAIVHAHAWIDGARCTRQNYPCGTKELATEVVDLLRQTEDPSRGIVGLKNHGLTITGHTLADIFDRIRGRLKTEVPMFA